MKMNGCNLRTGVLAIVAMLTVACGDAASGNVSRTNNSATNNSATNNDGGNNDGGNNDGGNNDGANNDATNNDATNNDTTDDGLCERDEHVSSGACAPCAAGSFNDAGDDPLGSDTRCELTRCAADERVERNACVACPEGLTNDSGDNAAGVDTFCDDACTAAVGVRCAEFEQAYVKASNTGANDRFGHSVAIDGHTMVVGAPEEDSNARAIGGDEANNRVPNTGAVYVFTRSGTTWTQQAYIKASSLGLEDNFGWSVSVSGDTLAVGTPYEDSAATGIDSADANNDANHSGAVWIFTRSGTTWSQEAYIKASNTDVFDGFGTQVALDGDTLAVGAPGEDSYATTVDGDQTDNAGTTVGAAYIFTRSGTTWSQQAYLKASNSGFHDRFGFSVAVDGDTAVVGAWGEGSNASSVDGDQADNSATSSGAAYVFVRSGTSWSQQAYIKASNSDANDHFGWSVAISGDTLAVGAPSEDSSFAGVGAVQTNNDRVESGAVYVFVRSGATWSQEAYVKASTVGSPDLFGMALALRGDTLVVSATNEHSNAVGLNGDEANDDAAGSGAVYVFDRAGATWTQAAYIKASNTDAGDSFGTSVSLDGKTFVVGALLEDSKATGVGGDQTSDDMAGAGAAYVRMLGP